MDLNEVAVFISVIKNGSFTKAARQLGMPNSTVSAKVSSLEARLGTTLIQRTTRKLNITPAGRAYYNRCLKGLEEIESAEAELVSNKGEPQGLLRITAPVELGSSILPPIIADYIKTYPKVSVEILLSDRKIDLLSEGVDLAIRAGELKDSTLISKKLGSVFFAPFASPEYLKGKKLPKHPRDLKNYECLHFTSLGSDEWTLVSPKARVKINVPGRISINDLTMLKTLTLKGQGIALLPLFYCAREKSSGQLIRLLPEWSSQMNPVHFIYAAQKFVTPKLSAFIALASESIKKELSGT